jgi:hypothetical protein
MKSFEHLKTIYKVAMFYFETVKHLFLNDTIPILSDHFEIIYLECAEHLFSQVLESVWHLSPSKPSLQPHFSSGFRRSPTKLPHWGKQIPPFRQYPEKYL